jgi:hypothetical protein
MGLERREALLTVDGQLEDPLVLDILQVLLTEIDNRRTLG